MYASMVKRSTNKFRLIFIVTLAMVLQLLMPMSLVYAGDNDLFPHAFNIGQNFNNNGWSSGNAGKTYEEGEWVSFITRIDNVVWDQNSSSALDRVGTEFTFYQDSSVAKDGKGSVFFDLVRNISVSTDPTVFTNNYGFPDMNGNPYPITDRDTANIAQNEDNEYIFSSFSKIDLSEQEIKEQINISAAYAKGQSTDIIGSRFDTTRVWYVTRDQILDALELEEADPKPGTIYVYYQMHLARSFLWNSLGDLDGDPMTPDVPLINVYSEETAPPYDWGGWLYTEDFLGMTTSYGAGLYSNGSPSNSQTYFRTAGGSTAGAKTLPMPSVGIPEARISGYKFNDLNNNEIWDPGEPPIEGWPITIRFDLYDIHNVEKTIMTDSNGYFLFDHLSYNFVYEITEGVMEGYTQSYPTLSSMGEGMYVDPSGPSYNRDTSWWKVPFDVTEDSSYDEMDRADIGWSAKPGINNTSITNANFGNTRGGYLKLIKTWSGYPDGFDDFPDEVTGTITGPYGYDETFTIEPDEFGVWEEIIGPLTPGEYTIDEDDVLGWSTTLNPADGKVDVTAGTEAQAASISIINSLDKGYLKIVKTWSGYPDGFDDYPEKVTGTITGPYGYDETFELFAPDWEETFGPLPPGEYTVSEVSIEGWTTSYPNGNSILVVAGDEEDAVEIEINNKYNLQLMSETAWGYLPGESDAIWDYVKTTNWGWTTEISEVGTYEFDLYAAAGQNILSNGFKVGTVEVTVTAGSEVGLFDVEVTYMIDEDLDYDYWLDEAHVWIGSTPLPTLRNGKMTNALGQFNYNPHISSDGLEAHLEVEDVEGPFWIALHSVVQWWE